MNHRVGDIMHPNPVCLKISDNLKKVVSLISDDGYSHIPVVDNGKLVGTVSKTDLIRRFIRMLNETSGKHYTEMMMEHISVEQMMHRDPIAVKRGDDIAYATELLLQGEFHGLIVVNDAFEVQGIVTAYDLLKSQNAN